MLTPSKKLSTKDKIHTCLAHNLTNTWAAHVLDRDMILLVPYSTSRVSTHIILKQWTWASTHRSLGNRYRMLFHSSVCIPLSWLNVCWCDRERERVRWFGGECFVQIHSRWLQTVTIKHGVFVKVKSHSDNTAYRLCLVWFLMSNSFAIRFMYRSRTGLSEKNPGTRGTEQKSYTYIYTYTAQIHTYPD